MKKFVIGIVVVALLGAGVFALTRDNEKPGENLSVTQTEQPKSEDEPKEVATIETNAVSIENFAYAPQELTIKKGQTVTWTNKDSAPHTVTSTSGNTLDSPLLKKGEKFSFTFSETGTFEYFCAPHPNMTGTVIVTE